MRKYLLSGVAAVLLSGCGSQPDTAVGKQLLVSSSFENLDGWLADSPAATSLTRERAHTGEYSTMIGPRHEFSLGYSNLLSRLAPDRPAKLAIGAWVWLPSDQAAAKLVTEIKGLEGGPNLLWEGLDVAQAAKVHNKWQYVTQTITLPPAAGPNNRLLVYLWRANSPQPVYLDDVSISLAQ
ncbi:carbohydrate binding domain-containing protein [Hymenobacter pini]|uniref:hypothetical protein n=1 Tax=Hymenobacter pini TaxID=2880879 RepID=UPI001CF47D85|nr:hypothetical protein [Hymenobacter pini]MCA8832422.1 hypothetical protein [Hymenobacter pini]